MIQSLVFTPQKPSQWPFSTMYRSSHNADDVLKIIIWWELQPISHILEFQIFHKFMCLAACSESWWSDFFFMFIDFPIKITEFLNTFGKPGHRATQTWFDELYYLIKIHRLIIKPWWGGSKFIPLMYWTKIFWKGSFSEIFGVNREVYLHFEFFADGIQPQIYFWACTASNSATT